MKAIHPVVTEIIGLQYGDEGKGKISCFETSDAKLVIRATGGNNAGHTVVYKDAKYSLHLIPSGIVKENAISILGPGMVIDPNVLIKEIEMLKNNGIKISRRNFMISDRAHIILPYHKKLDKWYEDNRSKKVGTTMSGIGPAYAAKANRVGLRMIDLVEGNWDKIEEELNFLPREFFDEYGISYPTVNQRNAIQKVLQSEMEELCQMYRLKLYMYIADVQPVINRAIWSENKILIEGAQAWGLDLDHGDYPFCTSSSPNASGTASAAGIGPLNVKDVIGVIKAYCSRVGEGPFITEQDNEVGKVIRDLGHEYGTTTGRPRRCGWLDLVQVRNAIIANSVSKLAITHLDTLGRIGKALGGIKVCVGYQTEDGRKIDYVSAKPRKLIPRYESLNGWTIDSTCTRYSSLPEEAKQFMFMVEAVTRAKISYIGIGPGDNDMIVL